MASYRRELADSETSEDLRAGLFRESLLYSIDYETHVVAGSHYKALYSMFREPIKFWYLRAGDIGAEGFFVRFLRSPPSLESFRS